MKMTEKSVFLQGESLSPIPDNNDDNNNFS